MLLSTGPRLEPRVTLLDKMVTQFRVILVERDIDYAELLACFAAFMWAVVQALLNPMQALPANYAFFITAFHSPDVARWTLITLMLIQGAAQALGVVHRDWAWRRATAFSGSILWAALFMGLLLGEPRSMGPYMAFLLAISEAWAYWRLRRVRP